MGEPNIKCVAVGDGCVGKTCLLLSICKKDADEDYKDDDYTPTIFDNHLHIVSHNGQTYNILFIDTAGQEGYNNMRKQLYEKVDVFLVCFDVSSSDSFTNVREQWLPEIEESPNVAKILIGTKNDLRNDVETIDKLNANNKVFVKTEVAKNFAESRKMKYMECSSKKKDNIDEIIKMIIEAGGKSTPENKSSSSNSCCCGAHPILRLAKRVLCCRNNY